MWAVASCQIQKLIIVQPKISVIAQTICIFYTIVSSSMSHIERDDNAGDGGDNDKELSLFVIEDLDAVISAEEGPRTSEGCLTTSLFNKFIAVPSSTLTTGVAIPFGTELLKFLTFSRSHDWID